jgi:glycosyltransferase involved in cell wall biosynthesis
MLTVMLATYDRARILRATLEAFCCLEPPEGGWKLVVVDNGSTDATGEVIASFERLLPLSCVNEPKRGKNAALNKGLSSVAGDLLVLTDDDVVPNPLWLKQMRSAADSRTAFSIFGGPVVPKWERPPEEWLLKWVPLDPTFAITLPTEEGPTEVTRVFGPNMALRASVFESGLRFDEKIGPKGHSYAQGSEAEFLKRLGRAGARAWHIRAAVVAHVIRASQMNRRWVLERAVRFGRGEYRIRTAQTTPRGVNRRSVRLLGIPALTYEKVFIQTLRVGRARLRKNAEETFREHWRLNYMIGEAIEARNMSKGQKTGRNGE